MNASSSIRLHQFQKDDWQDFRKIRLQALKDTPQYFLTKYEDAVTWPKEKWHEYFGNDDDRTAALFGLYDHDKVMGLASIFTSREDNTGATAMFAMGYIAPEYRGRKLSRLLYQARIDWALSQPQFKTLMIGHRIGNDASRRANQAYGFKPLGPKTITWTDGSDDTEYVYALDLENVRENKHVFFTTERLSCHPAKLLDIQDMFSVMNSRDTAENIHFLSWPITQDHARFWCERAERGLNDKTDYIFFARNIDGETVGCVGLHRKDQESQDIEIGYMVSLNHRGQGYAKEMIRDALNFAKMSLKPSSFFATTSQHNDPSIGLLQSFGFVYDNDIGTEDAYGNNGAIIRTSKRWVLTHF